MHVGGEADGSIRMGVVFVRGRRSSGAQGRIDSGCKTSRGLAARWGRAWVSVERDVTGLGPSETTADGDQGRKSPLGAGEWTRNRGVEDE